MAIRRRVKLTCHYCGVRSGKVQDGFVRQWYCDSCDTTNYLDDDGEIMDPPNSYTPDPSPPPRFQYGRKIEDPIFDISSTPQNDEPVFCDTCLRNQNIYQSLLNSYEPEYMGVDPSNPYAPDKNFLVFKQDLQRRYPQVCADCQRGVDERIKKANRMAQAEVLRHRLDKTKSKHSSSRTRTWVEFFALWGGVTYWAATAGQIMFCAMGLLRGVLPRISRSCSHASVVHDDPISDTSYPMYIVAALSLVCCGVEKILNSVESLTAGLPSLETLSIMFTIASFWWNPYYRNMVRGFDRHIHGFIEWYKYQIILLVTRIVFWSVIGKGQFIRSDLPSTMGLQIFMLGFTLLIARISRQSIKVDFRKLFPSTREDDSLGPNIFPAAQTSVYRGNDMAEILDSIASEPASMSWTTLNSNVRHRSTPLHTHDLNNANRAHSSSPVELPRPRVALTQMNDQEVEQYFLRGEIPAHMHDIEDGAMEWSPTRKSSVKDFRPQTKPVPKSVPPPPLLNEPNPFRQRVPAVPISTVQQGRRPFQKPVFQPVSEEKRENFFNSMTGRPPSFSGPTIEDANERREMHMAPPKFFAQNAFETTGLEDLMEKAFSLKTETPSRPEGNSLATKTSDPRSWSSSSAAIFEPQEVSGKRTREEFRQSLMYIFILGLVLGFWNLGFNHKSLETRTTALGCMLACIALSMRNLTSSAVKEWKKQSPNFRTIVATLLGALEAAFTCYLSSEILMGTEIDPNWQTKGAMLIGSMLLQEVWLLLF